MVHFLAPFRHAIYGVIIRKPEDTLLLLLKRFYDLIITS